MTTPLSSSPNKVPNENDNPSSLKPKTEEKKVERPKLATVIQVPQPSAKGLVNAPGTIPISVPHQMPNTVGRSNIAPSTPQHTHGIGPSVQQHVESVKRVATDNKPTPLSSGTVIDLKVGDKNKAIQLSINEKGEISLSSDLGHFNYKELNQLSTDLEKARKLVMKESSISSEENSNANSIKTKVKETKDKELDLKKDVLVYVEKRINIKSGKDTRIKDTAGTSLKTITKQVAVAMEIRRALDSWNNINETLKKGEIKLGNAPGIDLNRRGAQAAISFANDSTEQIISSANGDKELSRICTNTFNYFEKICKLAYGDNPPNEVKLAIDEFKTKLENETDSSKIAGYTTNAINSLPNQPPESKAKLDALIYCLCDQTISNNNKFFIKNTAMLLPKTDFEEENTYLSATGGYEPHYSIEVIDDKIKIIRTDSQPIGLRNRDETGVVTPEELARLNTTFELTIDKNGKLIESSSSREIIATKDENAAKAIQEKLDKLSVADSELKYVEDLKNIPIIKENDSKKSTPKDSIKNIPTHKNRPAHEALDLTQATQNIEKEDPSRFIMKRERGRGQRGGPSNNE